MLRKKMTMALVGLTFEYMFVYMQKKLCLPSNFCVKQQELDGDSLMQRPYFTYTRKYIAYIQQLD